LLKGEIEDIKRKDQEEMEALSAQNQADYCRSKIEAEREITPCDDRHTRVISGETK